MSDEPDLRDLPSLEQWGKRLRDATERSERHTARHRLPLGRLTLALAVMLIAVPGAVGTRSIWLDPIVGLDPAGGPVRTPAVRLAEGRSGDVQWRLGGYEQADGRRCVELQVLGSTQPLGGTCATVRRDRAEIIVATRAQGEMGFVFGTVSPQAAEVSVTVAGGGSARVATLVPDREALRRSGMPDVRLFIAAFPHGFDPSRPPVVVAYDARRAVLGAVRGSMR